MGVRELLGIEAPVVLGPFGGMSSVELTAAVSEAGGLGSFGLYGLSAERIRAVGDELRLRTSRPFALNLWLPFRAPGEPDAGDGFGRDDVERAIAALRPLFDQAGAAVPEWPIAPLPDFDAQLAAALDARPAALSFVFGVPPVDVVEAAHRRGIRVIGTATTVPEARALEGGGVDAVVASGSEAAGHRPSFLADPADSLVGGLALIPQVVDEVGIPVIAAGGIADRRGVAAAFALGASGVQVGSAFLATRQSAAPPVHRDRIRSALAHETVLTRAMSGRPARGLPNRAVRTIEQSGAIAPFPLQNILTGVFRRRAAETGDAELLSLWMGQSAGLSRHEDAAEVFAELAAGVPGRTEGDS
ncbi:nitronate monooxygenase [Leifsonia sp. 98AMF]|nr:nitronate monooxygenase [Leifsonia sp. 197AMF]SDI79902.1 nitronate monooxygenase [Leifsonia sp. 466MF]SDK05419.1 nitronate monooxygenase [Leifsonia sp. 157MF]SDN83420.1 nitronate monooxygenase [Leifsonia sp. 509MF]SEN23745.1 nitronate monooxygenase [Leifsonia sp. 467MF]SFL86211.1 nitronate monooxygenase [Leifsonia sp. 98AMF]